VAKASGAVWISWKRFWITPGATLLMVTPLAANSLVRLRARFETADLAGP
jgi:hypothetical protein